jgi:DNA-binding NarL/FixJ family response regulator
VAVVTADDLPLTKREREVISLLAEGHSNRDLAALLGIQEATVEVHLTHIYRKLGLENRTAAALWACRVGLSSRPSS